MKEDFPETLVVLGAAGGGRLLYWHVVAAYPRTRFVFVDDGIKDDVITFAGESMPILHEWRFDAVQRSGTEEFRYFLVSPTYPPVKKVLVEKALAAGLLPAPSIIHPQACFVGRPTITIGSGGLISPNVVVHHDTVIKDYVHLAPGVVLGHDCVVEDFVGLNLGCNVLGHVHIKAGVALGAGTTVREYTTIAPWVRTGIQACIVRDITEEGITVVGVPGRPLIKPPGTE